MSKPFNAKSVKRSSTFSPGTLGSEGDVADDVEPCDSLMQPDTGRVMDIAVPDSKDRKKPFSIKGK